MKKRLFTLISILSGISMWAQSTIAFWDFNSVISDGNTSSGTTTPATGNGSISLIGGTTATFAAGFSSDPNSTDNSGYNLTNWPAQGTNPKTAGIQVNVNTSGMQNIYLEFQQRLSNTAANTWVLQYTLDNTAGIPVWVDAQTFTFVPLASGTGDTWYFRSFNFTSVTGMNNNPNVSFRIVSDFDPAAGQYLAAKSGSTYAAGGTSRFDLIAVQSLPAVPYSLTFLKTDKTVSESAGTAKVWLKVTAAGNASGSINLAISSWSNAGLADYTIASATIPVSDTLVVNDTIAFTIDITDDAVAESDEYLICKLANGVNASFSSAAQHTLYIKDNDRLLPQESGQLSLNLLGSFNNGPFASNSAEISAYDPASKRIFIANSVGSKLDIVDFQNPASPILISSIDITPYGAINSVAVHNGTVALAIENGINKQDSGKVVFMDNEGILISQVTVGILPDMIAFNHSGTKVYTANEGEPNDTYTNDPDGSVSVIDISAGVASVTNSNVSHITFTSFNGQEALLRAQGIRIFGASGIASKDFEPEYITISDDDSKAWVTLQENNAMAELNLLTNTVTQLIPLGTKNHNLLSNGLDASNTTSGINISNYPIKGMYLPDAIGHYTLGGTTYLITANEGDSRAYSGMNEETTIGSGSYNLDPTAFPNGAELKNNSVLGKLKTTTKLGDIDNDGDFDEIYVYGARSFSIWNASTSSLVYDSGDDFEQITSTHPTYKTMFNASNGTSIVAKDRSDDKGPEPEGVATGTINGRQYAFIALERIGGVMVYDITDPLQPSYVTYSNNRGPDRGAEGIMFIPAAESPNGKNLVILSNETSSTLSIYEIEACTIPGLASINSSAGSACAGDSVKLYSNTNNSATAYQWLLNGQTLQNGTDSVYFAVTGGTYSLFAYDAIGCQDSSATITISIAAAPSVIVTPGSSTTFCAGDSVIFSAPFNPNYSYQWLNNNVIINGATDPLFTTSTAGTFAVVVTNEGICADTSGTYTVTVNTNPPIPVVNANGLMLSCSLSGLSYQWYFNGLAISGATSINYTATQNGNYSVEVTNASGCSEVSTPVSIQSVGLPTQAQTQALLFPNPSSGSISIKIAVTADYTIEVFNVMGQKADVISNQVKINRGDIITYSFPQQLNDGIYFIKIISEAAESTTRIILQR